MQFLNVPTCFMLILLTVVAPALAQTTDLRPVDINTDEWSAVAQINNSAYGRCTGVLIALDRVLTAAHCLFNQRTERFMRPESIHVVLGYNRGKYGFRTVAAEVKIGDGYDPLGPSPSSADYAVLQLAGFAPGNFRPLKVAEASTSSDFITAGFARERPEMLSISPKCRMTGRTEENLIVTNCQVEHGMSGGPLIDMKTGYLVGILIASGKNSEHPVSVAIEAQSLVPLSRPAQP